jgi:cytoskeletal protein RodZ
VTFGTKRRFKMKRGYGDLLKKAREEKGIKYADLNKSIKMDEFYIRAMEEENLAAFEKPIYMRLFLKTYARHLKIDYKEILKMFNESPEVQEILNKEKKKEIPLELRKEIVKEETPVDIKNRMPVELNLSSTPNLLLYAGIALAILPLIIILIVVAVRGGNPASDGKNIYMVKTAPQAALKLVVKAREDCWMKIRVDDKEEELTLKKGQSKEYKEATKIVFLLGNAGGVEFTQNNEYIGAIGQPNEVVNGLVFEAGKAWTIDGGQGFKSQAPSKTEAVDAAGNTGGAAASPQPTEENE